MALAIKIDSKGPVFFAQGRRTKGGKVFKMLKFRSMVVDAEKKGTGLFSYDNDPRVTRVGKFLRKTSIDELPQLFNILKGDMSIIGPRVALPREIELYPEEALDRLTVPQGLSGEWQANGRSDTSFQNMIEMDLNYITKKRGFWYDIGLIFKTIWVVITGKGAE